jgi:hypothetical protein
MIVHAVLAIALLVAAPAEPLRQKDLHAAFAGQWAGHLEYRDYSNDKRVKLPTELDASLSPDGRSVAWSFVYQDGPGKVVKSTETLTIDPEAGRFTFLSEDGSRKDEYQVAGLSEFSTSGQGTLVLTAPGEENGKTVDVRKTITLTPGTLTILKETRLPGAEFLFRNQYTFTRKP